MGHGPAVGARGATDGAIGGLTGLRGILQAGVQAPGLVMYQQYTGTVATFDGDLTDIEAVSTFMVEGARKVSTAPTIPDQPPPHSRDSSKRRRVCLY